MRDRARVEQTDTPSQESLRSSSASFFAALSYGRSLRSATLEFSWPSRLAQKPATTRSLGAKLNVDRTLDQTLDPRESWCDKTQLAKLCLFAGLL